MQGSIFRREIVISGLLGLTIALGLNIWFNIVGQGEAIDDHLWLARLQEPGTRAGEWCAHSLLPVLGYPWNVRCGVAAAYLVVGTMWTAAVLGGIALARITVSALQAVWTWAGQKKVKSPNL